PASASGAVCEAMACDGIESTACKALVDSSVSCRAGSCINGVAIARAGCDGHGACPPERSAPCAPFVCEPDGAACKARCDSDADCEQWSYCDQQTRICASAALCIDDTQLLSLRGEKIPCAPYTCDADGGQCRTTCSSVEQCIAPTVCSAAGACV